MFLNFLPIFLCFQKTRRTSTQEEFPGSSKPMTLGMESQANKADNKTKGGGGGHLVVLKDIKRNFEDLQDKKEYMSVHPTFYQPFLYECHF